MPLGRSKLIKYTQWLRGSGVRIASIFSVTTVVLLLVVNIFVSERSNRFFNITIPSSTTATKDFHYGPKSNLSPILAKQLMTDYPNKLHTVLLWVTAAGVMAAVVLGIVLGYTLITRPLKRLQDAIARLKDRDFRSPVPPTGLPEFDQVLADFNELAAELGRAEELRRDLISDTSHELKTPLQSLNLQIAGMRDGLVAKDIKQFDELLHQLDKLNALTEHLQEYARLRSRLVRISRKRQKLLPIVEASAQTVDEELRRHQIKVIYNIEPNYKLMADQIALEQLFTNLFRNTLTHASATQITISTDNSKITFADNGRGVDRHDVDHLFERFYRARTKRTAGLGLGLSIVHDIAEAHGWKVEASSTRGKGLKIRIRLD